jgi:hypothetical protein
MSGQQHKGAEAISERKKIASVNHFQFFFAKLFNIFLQQQRLNFFQFTNQRSFPFKTGLPDGLVSNQKYQFWYIVEGLGLKNLVYF